MQCIQHDFEATFFFFSFQADKSKCHCPVDFTGVKNTPADTLKIIIMKERSHFPAPTLRGSFAEVSLKKDHSGTISHTSKRNSNMFDTIKTNIFL